MVQNVAFLETDFNSRNENRDILSRSTAMTSAKEKESLRRPRLHSKLSTDLFDRFVLFDRSLSSSAQLRTSTAFFNLSFASSLRVQFSCKLIFFAMPMSCACLGSNYESTRNSTEINHSAGARSLLVIISGCSECNFLFTTQLGVDFMNGCHDNCRFQRNAICFSLQIEVFGRSTKKTNFTDRRADLSFCTIVDF